MRAKSKSKNKKKIFKSWFISYIVILIIPIIISLAVNTQSIKIINEEVNLTNDASLDQLKILIDSKLQEIQNVASKISVDDDVRTLMSPYNDLTLSELYEFKVLQDSLIKFVLSNEMIDGIYLYFSDDEFLLSDTNFYRDKNIINSIIYNNMALNEEEWGTLINSNKYREYVIKNTKNNQGEENNSIILFQSVYSSGMKSMNGKVIILVDEKKLNDLLSHTKWSSYGYTAILNSDNQIISDSKLDEISDFIDYESLVTADKLFYRQIDNSTMVISHVSSDVTDWECASIIPAVVYLEKVQQIRTLLYAFAVFCLALGLLLVFYLVKRNYSPIEKLMNIITNSQKKYGGNTKNEFIYMENSFRSLVNANADYEKTLRLQNSALRNNFISRLLKGRIYDSLFIDDSCKLYNVQFKSDNFIVLAFFIQDSSNVFFDENWRDNYDTLNLAYFVIRNVAEELCDIINVAYSAEIDGTISCLINIADKKLIENTELLQEEMKKIALDTIEILRDRFGIYLYACISNMHFGIAGISEAYGETLEIAEYTEMMGEQDSIIHYRDISDMDDREHEGKKFLEKEKQFINCIIVEDYKGASIILNDIIENNILNSANSLQLTKYRTFGLINSMINTIAEIKTTTDEEFFYELDPVKKLMSSKNISELQKQVNIIFEKLNEYNNSRKKESETQRISNVLEYINKNFTDPNLSVVAIADNFNISASYLSRQFKNQLGAGLLEYIHKLRIEKAKELMKNKHLNIKEIAEKVGYYNDVAIIRAFKKYEGITPGQHRKM